MSLKILCVLIMAVASHVSSYPSNQYQVATKTKLTPKPYSFSYGVSDQYQGTDFERKEESDGNVVVGSYSVQLPDGRKQTVTYEADHHNGFKADVSYHGEAHYPPPSKEPPFVVRASPYSPQQEHHNPHETQPINEYDQHFSRSSPDTNKEEVQSEIPPHIQTHFQHQEQPEIQHIHQQQITKPKIVIHESDEYERTHEPDVHLHHEPGHEYSRTRSEEFTHTFSDVPDPVLPEVSYDQPSLKQEYISEHETAIYVSNQPVDHPYQSIPHQDSNSLDKVIQNNYNEGKDSEGHVFVSENKIPTGYSPSSELEDDIHHNDIKLHNPSSGTHNIAPSNDDDLFIPQFINPSIPKLDQSFYQLLASSYNPFPTFHASEFTKSNFHEKPIKQLEHNFEPQNSVFGNKNLPKFTTDEEILKVLNHQIHSPPTYQSKLLTDDPHIELNQTPRVNHPPVYIPNVTEKPLLEIGSLFAPNIESEPLSQYRENVLPTNNDNSNDRSQTNNLLQAKTE